MDEKTRQLRDIFMDVAEDASVTERQEQSRGSLTSRDRIEERLRSTIESMRDRYGFATSLPTDALVEIVRGFYAGRSDSEIAAEVEGAPSPDTITRARIELHLGTSRDRDAPFDFDSFKEAVDHGLSIDVLAEDLGVSETTVRRYRRVAEADRERRVVGDRYREEFDRLLADRDLETRLTEELRETGLEDATEGMETNVSF